MHKAAHFVSVLAVFSLISCTQEPYGIVGHRNRDGRADQWLYESEDGYKILIDTNSDGRPDVVKAYRKGALVSVQYDRNFDGRVDLVGRYVDGILIREIHDDDFDGKTECIKEFRHGKVAIVERDPEERGYIDVVEFYDDAGKLIRRESRAR